MTSFYRSCDDDCFLRIMEISNCSVLNSLYSLRQINMKLQISYIKLFEKRTSAKGPLLTFQTHIIDKE